MAKQQSPVRRKATRTPILVIEPNPNHWLIIRSALAQCFPEVEPIWANYPAQALSHLANCVATGGALPALILQELHLPRREDGLALLESIKSQLHLRSIPLVMLSTSQALTDSSESYARGVASYTIKPATYHQWLTYFYSFRRYWWTAVTLPPSSR